MFQQKELVVPLGGINLYDPITALKPQFAVRLENLVCRADGLHVRPGRWPLDQGIAGAVTSLAAHDRRVFNTTATTINEGLVPRVSGLTSGAWEWETVTNPGGRFLWGTNGADGPRLFNGTAWSVPTITGVEAATLEHVVWHQRRVFASAGLVLWYLDTNAIAGEACPIYVEPLLTKGGKIAGIGSITGNAAKDIGDMLAVVTSKGELVIYAGSDPDHAESWRLLGVYDVSPPVPGKCFTKVGGQLCLLTVDGLVSVPGTISANAREKKPASLSRNVDRQLKLDAKLRDSGQRWQVIESAAQHMLIVHAPSELQTRQFVQSETSGWSTFENLGATCWLEHDDHLLFGTDDGAVCRLSGPDDAGQPINAFAVGSHNRYGTARRKSFKRIKLIWDRPIAYVWPRLELRTNYQDPPESFAAAYTAESWKSWDEIEWGDDWSLPTGTVEGRWRTIRGRGSSAALMMGFKTRAPLVWQGGQIAFEQGGSL